MLGKNVSARMQIDPDAPSADIPCPFVNIITLTPYPSQSMELVVLLREHTVPRLQGIF